MNNEITNPIRVADNTTQHNSSDAAHLSQSLFASPSDFLDTYKNVINKAGGLHNGWATADEIITYEKQTHDPKEKAAAQLAVDHWGDLQKMPWLPGMKFHDYFQTGVPEMDQVEGFATGHFEKEPGLLWMGGMEPLQQNGDYVRNTINSWIKPNH